MRQYERNGVNIDQCSECRGIFLDRGELERLVDAEAAWHGQTGPQLVAPAAPQSGYQRSSYPISSDDHHDRDRYGHGQPGYGQHKKKRRGFLEDLFD
jgi:uncharacterized protein